LKSTLNFEIEPPPAAYALKAVNHTKAAIPLEIKTHPLIFAPFIRYSHRQSPKLITKMKGLQRSTYLLGTALCIQITTLFAQPVATTLVPLNNTTSAWQVDDENHQYVTYKGKQALLMKQGTALLQTAELRDGIVELDIMPISDRAFAGICFRASDSDALEMIYLRFHKSGQMDALQYTPRYNGLDSWQLYHTEDYQTQATFKPKDWNHVQVKFEGSRAWIFLNGGLKASLYVRELLRSPQKGKVGVWALGEVAFANFSYSSLPKVVLMREMEAPAARVNSIINWSLSPAYNAESIDWRAYPSDAMEWQDIRANDFGLVNVSMYRRKQIFNKGEKNSLDVVFAKTNIVANKEELRPVLFDYSDQIVVFLNGKPLFRGDNSFRSKGPLYRGEVKAGNNILYLPLRKGDNELLIAVAERANGWGYVFKWE